MTEFCRYYKDEKRDGKCTHPENRGVKFPNWIIYPCSMVYCPRLKEGEE